MKAYFVNCKKNTANENSRTTKQSSINTCIKLCCFLQEKVEAH